MDKLLPDGVGNADDVEQRMSKRPRRNHSPAFKAKVALAALQGEKNLGRVGPGVRRPSQPNQRLEKPAFGTGGQRVWRRRQGGAGYGVMVKCCVRGWAQAATFSTSS